MSTKKPPQKKNNWRNCPPPNNPFNNIKYIDHCVNFITQSMKPITNIAEEKRTFEDLDNLYYYSSTRDTKIPTKTINDVIVNTVEGSTKGNNNGAVLQSYFTSAPTTEGISIQCSCCNEILQVNELKKNAYHATSIVPWTAVCKNCK